MLAQHSEHSPLAPSISISVTLCLSFILSMPQSGFQGQAGQDSVDTSVKINKHFDMQSIRLLCGLKANEGGIG